MIVKTEHAMTAIPQSHLERPAAQPASDAETFARLMRSTGLDASHLAQPAGDGSDARGPRVVAAQMVSTLFYAPLLAEMRKFSIGQEYASGGRTEEIFGEQLDGRIADAVAISDRGGLTDLLARQISGNGLTPTDRTPRAAREEAPYES